MNGTSKPSVNVNVNASNNSNGNISQVDDRADIIYQKDASFSAVLDTRQQVAAPSPATDAFDSNAIVEAVRFVTSTSSTTAASIISSSNNTSVASTDAARSTTGQNSRYSDATTCLKNCGAGTCVVQASDSDVADNQITSVESNQRCQCILGKTGANCQTGTLE